jgi:hypothetical protein
LRQSYSTRVAQYATSTPLFKRASSVGVTVIMFKADDTQAAGAFNAAEIRKKSG